MGVMQKLKRALIEMYQDGELEKILKYTKGSQKRAVKHDIKVIEGVVSYYESHNKDLNSFSVFSFIMALRSAQVLTNALCYMERYEEEGKKYAK